MENISGKFILMAGLFFATRIFLLNKYSILVQDTPTGGTLMIQLLLLFTGGFMGDSDSPGNSTVPLPAHQSTITISQYAKTSFSAPLFR